MIDSINKTIAYHGISSILKETSWNGTAHFLPFHWLLEGDTEKVLPFIMPLKVVYKRKYGLVEQKCVFEYFEKVKTRKRSMKWHYFWHKTFDLLTFFRVAPYMLLFALHKDTLFYCMWVTGWWNKRVVQNKLNSLLKIFSENKWTLEIYTIKYNKYKLEIYII